MGGRVEFGVIEPLELRIVSAVYDEIALVLAQPARAAEAAQINRARAFVEPAGGPH